MSTFGLSFIRRFILFRSVLYRRFHCICIICSTNINLGVDESDCDQKILFPCKDFPRSEDNLYRGQNASGSSQKHSLF